MNLIYSLLRPPSFEDEAKTRSATLLHFILLTLTPINLLTVIADVVVSGPSSSVLPSHLFTLAMMLFLFIPFYRGKIHLTGVILCTVSWLAFAYTAYQDEGIFNPIFGANGLIIIFAGLLINSFAALVAAGCSILFGAWLVYSAESGHYVSKIGELTARNAWVNDTAVFIVTVLFLYLSLRAIAEARERASKSEERYRSLVQHGPNLIYVVEPNHQIGFASYGMSGVPQNVEGRSIYDFILRDSTEIFQRTLNHVFKTRDPDRLEIEGRNANGQHAWFLSYFAPIVEDGQAVEVAVIMTDISARKRMELEQRATSEQYRKLFESNPHPMFVADWESLKILEVNDAMMARYGYAHDEFLKMSVPELGAPEDEKSVAERLDQYRRDDVSYDNGVVWRQRKKDGSVVWVEAAFHRLRFRGHEAALVANYDLTDRMNAEKANLEAEKLRLDLTKEREVLAVKENFIVMMSHEFRTPLSVILSSKETLEHYSDRISAERRLEKLHQIGDQVRYVIRLLDDVLMMGQAYAGKLKFNPVPLNLVEFCQKLFEEMQVTDRQGHQFVFQVQNEIGMVESDQQLLQHIIVNLVSNAMKYSPQSGAVRMEVGAEDEMAYIRVIDQGLGIPAEDQKHLFEPFHRADNVKGYQGTGLGLAIVKESVEVHGGTIICDSEVGKGTAFTVRLPLKAKPST